MESPTSPAATTLKRAAFLAATICAVPALVSFHVRALVLGRNRALEGSSQALSMIPGVIGQFIRRAFYARVLASCHWSVTIEFGATISKVDTRLDEHVYIGPNSSLGLVHLERDVLVGPGVHIPSGAHSHGTDDASVSIRAQQGALRQVVVGEGAWIGSNAVVMADVGRGSVVGAGAVVTKPVPDGAVVGGVPAQVISQRK